MTNPYDPAFPAEWTENGNTHMVFAQGMTKREYFAAMAMQAITSSSKGWKNKVTDIEVEMSPEKIAVLAIDLADELIAELSK